MLNAVGVHHTFVAISLSVAARYTRAIGGTDVIFMLIVISFIITGRRKVFFAGSHAQRYGQDHQAIGKKWFHV